MTDNNEHMGTLILAAMLIGNKRLIEVVKAINNIHDFEGHNPIPDYRYKIYKQLMKEGKKKIR